MKKIKLIPMLMIAILVLAYGCKKETELHSVQTEPAVIQELTTLSDNYISEQVPMKALPKWLKVVGADLGGAVVGAGIGAGVGSAVPGLGTGAGAIIGGVAAGASASIKEAGAVAPNPNATGTGSMPKNLNNPYNSAGEVHYESLHAYRLSGGNPGVESSYPYVAGKISSYYNIPVSTIESTLTLDDCEAAVLKATSNTESGNEAFLIDLFNEGSMSERIYNTLIPYARAIDASNPQNQVDLNNFVQYSISAENIVVNSAYLNDSEKAQVLIYMSTARYGMQYWFQYQ